MQLIRRIDRAERWPNGQTKPLGLFRCPFCEREVERPLYAGQRFHSCGCQQIPNGKRNPNYRHGACNDKLYNVWAGMIARCENKSHKSFKDYGAIGISVCPEWKTASNFIQWAKSNGYRNGLLIDRKKNELGYSPENCRWLTPSDSARNKRQTKVGIEMAALIRKWFAAGMSRTEIAKATGIAYPNVRTVLKGAHNA